MSFLTVKNVWKRYGASVVLEQVNTSVQKGEFITIVGTSGCGKTTFLKMLLGTEQPSQGQIILNDKPIPDEPGEDRGIVFQKYSVFPHLTVLQNLLLPQELAQSKLLGKLFGKARIQAREEARSMLCRRQ